MIDYDKLSEIIKQHISNMSRVTVTVSSVQNDVRLNIDAKSKNSEFLVIKMIDNASAVAYADKVRDEIASDFEFVKSVIVAPSRHIQYDGETLKAELFPLLTDKKGTPSIKLGKLNRIYLKGDFEGYLGISPGSFVLIGYNQAEDIFAFHKTTKNKDAFRVANRMYITAAKLFAYGEFNERYNLDEEPREYQFDKISSDSVVAIFRRH